MSNGCVCVYVGGGVHVGVCVPVHVYAFCHLIICIFSALTCIFIVFSVLFLTGESR